MQCRNSVAALVVGCIATTMVSAQAGRAGSLLVLAKADQMLAIVDPVTF